MRLVAAGAGPLLATGVYISYSRGALAVAVLGLLVLAAAAPSRPQVRAAAVILLAGAALAVLAALLPGVASLSGAHRARDGAVMLAGLSSPAVATALPWRCGRRAPRSGLVPRLGGRGSPRPLHVAMGLIVGGFAERPSARRTSPTHAERRPADDGRLQPLRVWRVALDVFADAPGARRGPADLRVAWLEQRPITEAVRDTHSLELEVAAELGLSASSPSRSSFTASAVAARGHCSAAARRCRRRGWPRLLVWYLHASMDWDSEMPAVDGPGA